MNLPVCVANKRLTGTLTPLYATLTKTTRGGASPCLAASSPHHSPIRSSPSFSVCSELFCAFSHFANIQLLCSQAIPHSLQKNRGCTLHSLAPIPQCLSSAGRS